MADNSLFGKLKKLFATQVVVRRVGKDKLKVVDSSRLQSMEQTQERIGKVPTNDLITIQTN